MARICSVPGNGRLMRSLLVSHSIHLHLMFLVYLFHVHKAARTKILKSITYWPTYKQVRIEELKYTIMH